MIALAFLAGVLVGIVLALLLLRVAVGPGEYLERRRKP